MTGDNGLGRVAWITGAGKGIGRALALRLADEGLSVVASARTARDLESLVAEADGRPGRIVAQPVDVTHETAVARCAEDIESSLGPIDLLVCNAGTHVPLSVEAFESATFRDLMEVNVMGTVHCLAAVLPRLVARRRGRIAVMSSVAGYRGLPSAAAYGASKAALINMCEAMKPDLDRHGVGLSVVCPGFVRTPLTDRNAFPMPFMMEAGDAAERIVRGLRRGKFEIAFPRRFTMWLKLGRCLPYAWYFRFTRRMTGNHGRQ
jgi:NAD(P)-dependent dehydrogenase (short-subunit alcohol dehydrogenase family)